jgi:transcriptional regulator with XRE-family HTH domain
MSEYYKDYLDYFANRISKLRTTKGVSARDMSLSIGQSEGYIGQIERKHNLPSMSAFLCLCEYLGITPKEFFDDVIEAPAVFLELMNNSKDLNEEQLRNINNIVKDLKKSKSKTQK